MCPVSHSTVFFPSRSARFAPGVLLTIDSRHDGVSGGSDTGYLTPRVNKFQRFDESVDAATPGPNTQMVNAFCEERSTETQIAVGVWWGAGAVSVIIPLYSPGEIRLRKGET